MTKVRLTDYPLAEISRQADGTDLEWEVIGSGPPLVWVEGGPGFWAHMARPDVQLVSDIFRAHLVNAPGCGRTSRPTDVGGYALASIVSFFEEATTSLGLRQVTVMGHSWGGLVAAVWASRCPAQVSRLVIIDGYPGGASVSPAISEAERRRALQRHASATWFEAAIEALEAEDVGDSFGLDEADVNARFDPVWPLYFSDPASALAAPHLARIRREVRLNVEMSDAWYGDEYSFDDVNVLPELANVSCPTLVVAGEHDFICGPEWNRPMADAIRGSRYVEVSDAGHMPHYEQPEAFRAALVDWLKES